ncbi:hypothetical protein BIW11_10649, partial [Tropilaelaps mercedesae]
MTDRATVQVIGRKVRLIHPPPALNQQTPKTKVVLMQRAAETSASTLTSPVARICCVTPRPQLPLYQQQQPKSRSQSLQQPSNSCGSLINVKHEAVHVPATSE